MKIYIVSKEARFEKSRPIKAFTTVEAAEEFIKTKKHQYNYRWDMIDCVDG